MDDIGYDPDLYDTMHIDVQGYELEVLKGAVASLASIDEITVEVNRAELYEGCPMAEEIIMFLEDQGFALITIEWMGGTWGDCLMRRI